MLYHIMGGGENHRNKRAVHCQKLLKHEEMLFSSENHKPTIPISHNITLQVPCIHDDPQPSVTHCLAVHHRASCLAHLFCVWFIGTNRYF